MSEMYAVVRSNSEVRRLIDRYHLPAYRPVVWVQRKPARRMRNRRMQWVTVPVCPGYEFVHSDCLELDVLHRSALTDTTGEFATVSLDELMSIDQIHRKPADPSEAPAPERVMLAPSTRVTGTGVMEGRLGTVVRHNRGMMVVQFDGFPVEVLAQPGHLVPSD